MSPHTEYRSSWYCSHPPERHRPLGNGEMACDDCMHVAVRKDGTAVVWGAPPASHPAARHGLDENPAHVVAAIIRTAGAEPDEAEVERAAALAEEPAPPGEEEP